MNSEQYPLSPERGDQGVSPLKPSVPVNVNTICRRWQIVNTEPANQKYDEGKT